MTETSEATEAQVKWFGLNGWAGVQDGHVVTRQFRTKVEAEQALERWNG